MGSTEWLRAIQSEMQALHLNQTWTLVPPPIEHNIVGCKWLFCTKFCVDGSIERYKARLVAQGYNQVHGLDFSHTFSPVVKASTIHMILSLAVINNCPLHQLDVNNSFLHGTLSDTVYMQQPPGFVDPHHPSYVFHLHKAIYGLKQALRSWFHRLSSFLLTNGFTCSQSDPSLFIFKRNYSILYLTFYIDDLILTGNRPDLI